MQSNESNLQAGATLASRCSFGTRARRCGRTFGSLVVFFAKKRKIPKLTQPFEPKKVREEVQHPNSGFNGSQIFS